MDGKGFTRYVEAGDVSAGQPILLDDEAIKAAGHDDVVTCVVSNPQSWTRSTRSVPPAPCSAGARS
ncbi:MAG: hypothetical protein ACLTKG_00905 [Collinsella intestinalis]